MTKEQRKRLAAIRAIAPLATKEREPDEVKVEEACSAAPAGDESPPEDLPQANRASHYS